MALFQNLLSCLLSTTYIGNVLKEMGPQSNWFGTLYISSNSLALLTEGTWKTSLTIDFNRVWRLHVHKLMTILLSVKCIAYIIYWIK